MLQNVTFAGYTSSMSALPSGPWSVEPVLGLLRGAATSTRRLSDLSDLFRDEAAVRDALAADDRLVYSVSTVDAPPLPGALSFGLGRIEPGCVGREFHMTRGHVHAVRDASEVYVGLEGRGLMLLHDLRDEEASVVRMDAGDVVYVPGHVAHRTVNVGREPLRYLGVYPSDAGHDYQAIALRPFPHRVVSDGADGWRLEPRTAT